MPTRSRIVRIFTRLALVAGVSVFAVVVGSSSLVSAIIGGLTIAAVAFDAQRQARRREAVDGQPAPTITVDLTQRS